MFKKIGNKVRTIGGHSTAITVYDNLEFNFGVQDFRDGEVSQLASVTTGLVHRGIAIPDTGLKRFWLDFVYKLRPYDIISEKNKFLK